MWDEDSKFQCTNLIIYYPDTDIKKKISNFKRSDNSPTICRQTGIIVFIQKNKLIAINVNDEILWKQNIDMSIFINAIGYGLLTLGNDTICWIIDMYTGKKLLQVDKEIIDEFCDFSSECTAIKNEIGYKIIWKNPPNY